MARALWKGTLGFGLVSIPVELHTAVRDLGPHFNFLRRSDKSRISFLKVAKEDGEAVSPDQLVRGYEYEKGRYVILEKEDFEAAAVKRDSRIELLDFVAADDVDDRFFDKPYYLLPAKGGEKAYALLRDALRESGRVGIAKIVLRNKSHLAAVETVKDALVLSTMRFREEVIPVANYDFPQAEFRKQELQIAHQLIEALVANWDPDKYTDEYRANLLRIIEAKRKRQKPKLEKQEVEADAAVVDLMERLRRSLGRAAGGRDTSKRTKGRRGPGAPARGSGAPSKRAARGKVRKRAPRKRAAQ
ncbi:MAG TPA: Ku protein [Vicinamibacterales bacterium]|nr:Ku protein [Vicinamibacterales bacterium]